jgi:hypothetical protein
VSAEVVAFQQVPVSVIEVPGLLGGFFGGEVFTSDVALTARVVPMSMVG